MSEVRRSRVRDVITLQPVPVGRSRIRVTDPGPPAPVPTRTIRRTPSHLIDTDKVPRAGRYEDIPSSGEVEVFDLRVEVEVLQGVVSPADFQVWMQEAVKMYHSFRHGYMDPCLGGAAKCPHVYLLGGSVPK